QRLGDAVGRRGAGIAGDLEAEGAGGGEAGGFEGDGIAAEVRRQRLGRAEREAVAGGLANEGDVAGVDALPLDLDGGAGGAIEVEGEGDGDLARGVGRGLEVHGT